MVPKSASVKNFVVPLLTQLPKMLKWKDFKFTFSIMKELKQTVKVTMQKNQNNKYFLLMTAFFYQTGIRVTSPNTL